MTGPILALDSATPMLALALVWPDGRVERTSAHVDRALAREIGARIDTFMASAGVQARDLRGICVGVGPGSITGARVGVAWALGVGRGLDVPVWGGDTLFARATAAHAANPSATQVSVAVAAGKTRVCTQDWRVVQPGRLEPSHEPRWVTTSDLSATARASLEQAPDAAAHVAGAGERLR